MNAQTKIAAPQVYAKIAAVQAALAKSGISKSRNNQQQGYKFRGIDEVYNTLAPLLAEHGLSILPRILSRDLVERKTAKGSPLFYVVVEAEFDFVCADDASVHTVRTYGEAMDSADKATNKAMSAAYKYAALMAFAIPTEGDNDADAVTHEVAAAAPAVIDNAQWSEIMALMQATNADAQAFCTAYRIDNVRALPADAFERAKKQLNTKLAKMAEQEKADA